MNNMAAVLQNMNIAPRFEVHELKGDVEKVVFTYKAKKGANGKTVLERVETVVKEAAGWMVYTPKGGSFRVSDKKELARLGMLGQAELVDMDTGEVVPTMNMSLRAREERRVKLGPVHANA